MKNFFKKNDCIAVTSSIELAQIIKKHNVIPVPVYSDKIARNLIVQARGIIFLRKSVRKKPIEF